MFLKPEQRARVHRPAPRRHHRPFERRESHAGVDAPSVANGACRNARADMRDHDLQRVARSAEQLRTAAGRPRVRKAVKPIAAHAPFAPVRGHRVRGGVAWGCARGTPCRRTRSAAGRWSARAASRSASAGGRWSGASSIAASSCSRTWSSTSVACRTAAPPCTSRCATASTFAGSCDECLQRSDRDRRHHRRPARPRRRSSSPMTLSFRLLEPALTARMRIDQTEAGTAGPGQRQSRISGMSSKILANVVVVALQLVSAEPDQVVGAGRHTPRPMRGPPSRGGSGSSR